MFHSFSKAVTVTAIAAAAFGGVSATALAAPAAHASAITLTVPKPASPTPNVAVQQGNGGGATGSITKAQPADTGSSAGCTGTACGNGSSNTTQNGDASAVNGVEDMIGSMVVGIPTLCLDLIQGFLNMF